METLQRLAIIMINIDAKNLNTTLAKQIQQYIRRLQLDKMGLTLGTKKVVQYLRIRQSDTSH